MTTTGLRRMITDVYIDLMGSDSFRNILGYEAVNSSLYKKHNIEGVAEIHGVYTVKKYQRFLKNKFWFILAKKYKADSERASNIIAVLSEFWIKQFNGRLDAAELYRGSFNAKNEYLEDFLKWVNSEEATSRFTKRSLIDAKYVFETMNRIHNKGLEYADLREGNIMFDTDNTPVIINLGDSD